MDDTKVMETEISAPSDTPQDNAVDSAAVNDNKTNGSTDTANAPATDKSKENEPVVKIPIDHNHEDYSVHVKGQYLMSDRPEVLGPLREIKDDEPIDGNGDGEKSKKNKKRPRDDRINAGDKMCMAILRGDKCPYGDKCRFQHDLSTFMRTRESGLQIEVDTRLSSTEPVKTECKCYLYDTYGHCPYGVMCRFGDAHLNLKTGENYKKDECKPIPAPFNVLEKDIQIKLRKKKFPFKFKRNCDRNNEEKKDENVDQSETTTNANKATNSSDPLPSKEKRKIDFNNKVYIAPLTTVGNLPFRRVMKRMGADITCGEMALTPNLLQGQASEWALLKRHPEEDVFGVQLAGGYPDILTRTAEVIESHENFKVDFIDLNLGCPLDIICDKGAGASLMLRDNRLKGILRGLSPVLSCPVTIKMRTGWDTKTPVAHNLVQKVLSWNVDGIGAFMVHGRSRLQRYSKLADWEYISQVATTVRKYTSDNNDSNQASQFPVIGNGDIYSYQDYVDGTSHPGITPCAMLARGALIKPWLPTEIKEKRVWDISASERFDMLRDFVHFGLEHWGSDQQGVNNTRRFLLEWLSFLHRYIPVGLLEGGYTRPQMNHRPPVFMSGRNDLETLFLSDHSDDWIKISERLLGKVPEGFRFEPKHKAKGYYNKRD